jgi:sarcosine oxidase delta subunit
MLVCPHCGERTRVGFQFDADGVKQRHCHKCVEPLGES